MENRLSIRQPTVSKIGKRWKDMSPRKDGKTRNLGLGSDPAPKGTLLPGELLRLIWKEQRISRAEIARRLALSRSTVTEIVKNLLETGLVSEAGTGQSMGGRRPTMLEFRYEAGSILGVDIGATHVSVALTDLRGQQLVWKEKKHPVRQDPEGTRSLVMDLCDSCLATKKTRTRRLFSICVAVPSPIDPLHPDWLSEVVIPAWRGHSELEILQRRYGVPVYVDNDANLGALAEHRWGAGRNVDDMLYVKLSHGIGAGHILRGELYRGARGLAGEVGHMSIDPRGELCVCGLKGCLATVVGAEALESRAKTLLKGSRDSRLSGAQISIHEIENAALAGDLVALHVVQEAVEYLSNAIVSWINLMNPSAVVLGGSLVRLDRILLNPIREKVRSCTLVESSGVSSIRLSQLGPRAVAIGAATLAMEQAFARSDFNSRHRSARLVVPDK